MDILGRFMGGRNAEAEARMTAGPARVGDAPAFAQRTEGARPAPASLINKFDARGAWRAGAREPATIFGTNEFTPTSQSLQT